MNLTVIPLIAEKKNGKFSFFDELKKILENNKFVIKNGDVLVISSKFIANSQGRILQIDNTIVSDKAKKISTKFNSNQKLI